jgi:hypothetical protein
MIELFTVELFTLDDLPVQNINHKTWSCNVLDLLSKLRVFTPPTDPNGTPALSSLLLSDGSFRTKVYIYKETQWSYISILSVCQKCLLTFSRELMSLYAVVTFTARRPLTSAPFVPY